MAFTAKALARIAPRNERRLAVMLGAWVVALVSAAIAGSEIATGVALVGGVLALTFVGRDRGDARTVAVRIEGTSLHVGDRAIPVSDVRELHRERGVTYDAVEIVTDALRITLQGKPAKTTRILEALRTATGLTDPTPIESLVGHALGVPGWDDAFAWLVASAGIALVAATLLGHVPFGLAFPLAMLLTAAWVVATRPGSVVAERDGVHVRWLWIRRFIHVREITTTAARGPRETIIVTATRRVASNDVANPHLRIALRAIADEDDEAAARAIDDHAQQR